MGLLGDKFIDMDLGQSEAERLKEGSLIPSSGGEGFDNLAKDASAALNEVKEIARTIKESLRDDEAPQYD